MTKPNKWGQPSGKFSRWGQGSQPQSIPQKVPITFSDFRGGYNSAPGDEEGEPNSSPNCQDILISNSNRLVRMPGGVTPGLQWGSGALFTEMLVHQSLQNIGELLFLGPPYLGVLSSLGLSVTDRGLETSPELFRWALYGETLILTNGRGVYRREPGQDYLTPTPSIPIGKTYGVLSSRLFVGGAYIDGEYQPMGIAWNSGEVDPEDFVGEGSGTEILIVDAAHGDAIVCIRMMTLDLMAIVCKQSIWIGRRTQDPFRPAAFEPRVMGDGGLHDRACMVTPLGMTYLAETGLRAFDGNNSRLISAPINNELLPIDFDKINDYRVNYDFKRNWVYLHTPACTWIYDVEYQRWYKMAVPGIVDMVIWKDQLAGVSWADLQAQGKTWADLASTSWFDLSRRESGWGKALFLQRAGGNTFYWLEDKTSPYWPTINPAISNLQAPKWEFRHKEGQFDNTIITIDAIIIKYAGSGDIRVYLPDNEGNPRALFRQTLPAPQAGKLRSIQINMIWSGKGAAAVVELISGNLEIAKFQMAAQVRSANPSSPGSNLQEYYGFWDTP